MAPTSPSCSSCGAPLSPGAIQGLCLACLLKENTPDDPLASAMPSFPRSFGPFSLLNEVGRGGMGIVYRAHQASLNRIVAVKVLLLGDFAGVEFRERFRAEAQAAARLKHPHIVPVHEIGCVDGEWFFTMDFIAGQSLAQQLQQSPLPPRTAAALLLKIARATHSAHTHGIIHRDLKPSNILVDSDGEPRITDFGLAKDIHAHSDLTHTGQILGSPSYMPPEQAAGQLDSVGVRSDVYSLGAVLFAMLTGHPPFQAHSAPATLRLVLESAVPPLGRFNPSIPRDLETLCLKCLEKDPARRYASALDLADDLDRFLTHRPILARPVGPIGKLTRWSQRHPLAASLTLALVLVSALGAAGILTQWQRARSSERRARAELYAADLTLAHEALTRNEFARARAILDRHPPPDAASASRRWEWNHIATLTLGNHLAKSDTGLTPVLELGILPATARTPSAASPPNSPHLHLALFSPNRSLQSLEFSPPHRLTPAPPPSGGIEWKAWKAAEGGWAGIDSHGALHLSAPGQSQTSSLQIPKTAHGAATGLWPLWKTKQAVLATRNSLLWIDTSTGQPGVQIEIDEPRFFADPDRDALYVGDRFGMIRVFSAATGKLRASLPGHSRRIEALACSPDGSRLVSAALDDVRVWDAPRRAPLAVLPQTSGATLCAAFSPDGRQFVTAGSDRVPRVWDTASLQPRFLYRGPQTGIRSITFSPDGATLVAGDGGGAVWVWPVPPPPDPLAELPFKPQCLGHSIAPDGSSLATVHSDGAVNVIDIPNRRLQAEFVAPLRDLFCGATSPNGALLAAGTTQGSLQIRQSTAAQLHLIAQTQWPGQRVWAVAFNPSASQVAVATEFGSLRLLELRTLQELQSWPIPGRARGPLLFSHRGDWIAFASNQNRAGQILLVETRPHGAHRIHDVDPPEGFAFSPDDRWLASVHGDGTLRVEHLPNGTIRQVSNSQAQRLTAVAFSPDGARIVAGAADGSLIFWDANSLAEVASFRRQTHAITDLFFVPGADTLVSVTRDGLRYWPGLAPAPAIASGASRMQKQ